MSAHEMGSVEEFLSHRSSEGGGDFMRWKKENDGKVNVWLHTKILPIAVWQHRIPTIVVLEDKDTEEPVVRVFGRDYVCPEDESILKKQYKTDDNGNRKNPPSAKCGVCRLIYWVECEVAAGRIPWTHPIFRFEADDGDETTVVHAGGFYGSFRGDDLGDDDKRILKAAGISLKDSWRENAMAKLSYAFAVVNDAAPEDGLRICVETGSLGDHVKDVINDTIASLGKEKGNPFMKPYCIQWEYREKEQRFDKKYKARRMEEIALRPDVEAIIRGPKPDMSAATRHYDPATVRTMLEKACLIRAQVPWDALFGGMARPTAPASEFPHGANAPPPQQILQVPQAVKNLAATIPGVNEPGALDEDELLECAACFKPMLASLDKCPHCGSEDTVRCVACPKTMLASAAKCPHCGKDYSVTGAAPQQAAMPPPPPAVPSRRGRGRGRAKGPEGDAAPPQNPPGTVDDLAWGQKG